MAELLTKDARTKCKLIKNLNIFEIQNFLLFRFYRRYYNIDAVMQNGTKPPEFK